MREFVQKWVETEYLQTKKIQQRKNDHILLAYIHYEYCICMCIGNINKWCQEVASVHYVWRTQILAVSVTPLNLWLTYQLHSYTKTGMILGCISLGWRNNVSCRWVVFRPLPPKPIVSFSKRRSLNGTRSDVKRVRSRLALERIVRSFDGVGWGKRGTGGFFSTWTERLGGAPKSRVRNES